jgi:hypothetical protein
MAFLRRSANLGLGHRFVERRSVVAELERQIGKQEPGRRRSGATLERSAPPDS